MNDIYAGQLVAGLGDIARALNKLAEHADKVFEINLENAVVRVLQEENARLNMELFKTQGELATLKMALMEAGARAQYERHERAFKAAQSAIPQGVPGAAEVPAGADSAARTDSG